MAVATKFDEKNLQLEEQRFRVLESLDKFRQLVGVDEAKFTDSLNRAFGVNSAHKLNWDQIGIAFSVLEKIHSDGGADFCEASFSEASQPGFSADLTLKV